LFSEQGLTADYWEQENLNALLARHREVDRSFFENETELFSPFPRSETAAPAGTVPKRPNSEVLRRDLEIGRVRDFLASNELFLVFTARGA